MHRRWRSTARGLLAVAASAALAAGSATLSPAAAVAADKQASATGSPAPVRAVPKQSGDLRSLTGGSGASAEEQAAMATAGEQARKSGKPVVVDALTTETTQVVAQPKGGFQFAGNPEPVRTRKAGTWTPVDTALHRAADGTFAPAATAYGTVAFSGGGNGPLAVTSSGGTSYTVSWPTALPTPAVSGDSATYAEVLPGVDLVVSATAAGGFRDVLVVKNAQAAKNPALAAVKLAAKVAGGTLATGKAQGGITVAGGAGVLETGTPIMWDSSTAQAASSAHKDSARTAADPSDAGHPGAAAKVAVVQTKATKDSLTLVPDAKLLTDGSTVFPAYIDPTFNWHPASANTPAFDEVKQGSPCNGASYYNDSSSNADNGYLGVGVNAWTSCFGIMRAYYQWTLPTVMWDADINSGTVNATKVYSASCSETPTVYLHWAGGIGSGTDWNNQPSYGGALSSAQFGPAYNQTYCPGNGSVTHGLDVTGPMQQAAAGHWSQFTGVLTEDDYESSGNSAGFSRFSDNPSLQLFFNLHPNTPGTSDLSAVSGSDNAGCATSAPYPYMGKTLASNTPVLNTKASDPDGDALQAQFKYWVDGSTSTATGLSGDNLGSGSTASFSLPSSFTGALTNGQVVDWQAQVTDGAAWSDWSPVCHFIAQPNGPDSPAVAANSTYPNTDNGGGTGAPAGTGAKFTVTANPGGAPATTMVYGVDQLPATSGTPANQTAAMTGSAAANPGGRWQLAEGSGTSGADSSSGNHPATLSGGAGWATDPTHGTVLSLDGSTGYAATAAPVLTTNQAFTVSTWANLSSLTNNSTFASQSGGNAAGFQLYYSASNHAFAFGKAWADDTSGSFDSAYGPTSGGQSPQTGTWYNLVGSYDPATQKLSLYVNGALAGTATYGGTSWNATGPVQIGRRLYSGSYGEYAAAEISDVQLYPRALTSAEVNTVYATATITVTPQAPGPHTLWTAAVDAAGDVSAMTAYRFTAAGHAPTSCASLTACLNNTAITADTNPSAGSADGTASFSATDLANAGWKPGQQVTIDGATFTLPNFGSGQADNVLAANQTIGYNQALPAAGSSALVLLATTTHANFGAAGAVGGAAAPYVPAGTAVSGVYCFNSANPSAYCPSNGVITYSDGSKQAYSLAVPDWVTGPTGLAAVNLPHRNNAAGSQFSDAANIYPFSIPLAAGKTVSSITLPDVGADPSVPALHVFGLATRNTTAGTAEVNGSTAATAAGQSWTGAWGSPTEGNYTNQGAGFSNQTFRISVKPSISGNTVRVKLDDALGTSPLAIGHATVATAVGNYSDLPTATPISLTFGGAQGVTIPQGGMAYSDPLPFQVTAAQTLIVSFTLTNTVPYLVEHSWADNGYSHISATGSGDHTMDTTDTAFTATGTLRGWFTDVLTDVDVTTAGIPTQAVLGDGLIDAWQPNTLPVASGNATRLFDDLALAEPSTPSPYGTVAEGIEANQVMKDNPQTHTGYLGVGNVSGAIGGVSALSRIDRDILDQPGLNTVVLHEGLEDVLGGQTANNLTINGYSQLLSYLRAAGVNVIVVGQTPCDGYGGDGASSNDPCTATVDGYRTTVNNWLASGPLGMNPWTSPTLTYVNPDLTIGTKDPANNEIKLNTNADNSDHVNLSTSGYAALATAILGAQDTWRLGDGSSSTAGDTASNTGSAYLGNNPKVGQNPATLSGGYSWASDPARGTVLKLDGTSGAGTTGNGPVLNTAGSFSVSAWANLATTPTGVNATIAAQSGSQQASFLLQYNQGRAAWCLKFTQSDTSGAPGYSNAPCSSNNTAPGSWVHLVGVYNAATQTAQLYVNGALAATGTGIAPWSAPGNFTIGSAMNNGAIRDFFPGMLSGVQAWNYALSPYQVSALYQQISPVH